MKDLLKSLGKLMKRSFWFLANFEIANFRCEFKAGMLNFFQQGQMLPEALSFSAFKSHVILEI